MNKDVLKKIMNKDVMIILLLIMNIAGIVCVYRVNNNNTLLSEISKDERMDKTIYRVLLEKEQSNNSRLIRRNDKLRDDIYDLKLKIETLEKDIRR